VVVHRGSIWMDVARALRSAGMVALFGAQDFPEIPPLADRVAVLNGGQIVQIGTPRDIFSHPANAAVERLVRAASDLIRGLAE